MNKSAYRYGLTLVLSLLLLLTLQAIAQPALSHHLRPPPIPEHHLPIPPAQQKIASPIPPSAPKTNDPEPALTLPSPSDAALNALFNIVWLSSTNCQTPPADAQIALEYAANLWATWISSTVPIAVSACWADNLGSSALGTGIPSGYARNFPHAPQVNTYYSRALANALSGSDLHPELSDIRLEFNANVAWSFATTTPAGGNDFVSVALHELAHGLGFIGNMYVYYNVGWCGDGPFAHLYPCPTPYDRLAVDSAGVPLLAYQGVDPPALRDRLQGDAHSGGPNTRAAHAGATAKLYAPPSWEWGSSFSHLDPTTFGGGPNRLMLPFYAIARHPGPVTLAIFQDMGWLRADGVPNVAAAGPLVVGAAESAAFTGALVWEAYAGQPLTYVWEAADHPPVVHPGQTTADSATFQWNTPGEKGISLSVTDGGAHVASALLRTLVFDLTLSGPAQGDTNRAYTFQAQAAPDTIAWPISYTWEATDHAPVVRPDIWGLSDSYAFTWVSPGPKQIAVTAVIGGAAVQSIHTIQIEGIVFDQFIYLPLTQR